MNAPAERSRHEPVLLAEVVAALAPRDGGTYVDGTFGAGGYARGLLEAAGCAVLGIDRDPDAIRRGRMMVDRYQGRLTLIEGRFGVMDQLAAEQGIASADGVALDLGVSSMQIDEPGRGFSFRHDGPLDMRMERSGRSAADLVNALPERDLAELIAKYGEERRAATVARAIIAERAKAPIATTGRLAGIVRAAVGRTRPADGIDPATRTFQALRIAVNDELGELGRGLAAAERLLRPGGRLAVVSFHSLEDRQVKEFLRARSGLAPSASRHLPPAPAAARPATFRLVGRGPITPGAPEIERNPRARSAKLRTAERTPEAPWREAA